MHKGFNLSTSLPTLIIFCFLTIAILMSMEWNKQLFKWTLFFKTVLYTFLMLLYSYHN